MMHFGVRPGEFAWAVARAPISYADCFSLSVRYYIIHGPGRTRIPVRFQPLLGFSCGVSMIWLRAPIGA